VICLLLVMSVVIQFVVLVMNMNEKMGINLVLSAKLDTKDTKVSYLVCLIDCVVVFVFVFRFDLLCILILI
jgi:hypothetical protein